MTIRFMLSPLITISDYRSGKVGSGALAVFVMLLCLFVSASTVGQSLEVSLVDQNLNPVEGAVIEVILPDELKPNYLTVGNVIVDQVDKEFVPLVSTVVAGNEVSFPNSDNILHHVYSFSPINTFNIPLYGKEEQAQFSQLFAETGVVEIGCNIHDWMLAYIYVAETSLNSISNTAGVAAIAGLPSGMFQLRIWHPRLNAPNNSILLDVALQGEVGTSVISSLELMRDRQIRRAPSAAKKRYR